MVVGMDLNELFNYDEETGVLTNKVRRSRRSHVGMEAGCVDTTGYLRVKVAGRMLLVHRVIFSMVHGIPIEEIDQIDHINGDRLDNRIANLRHVTGQENQRNQKKYSTNTSGYLGVSWQKAAGKYRASIMVDGKTKHLGFFKDLSAAVAAREQASIQYGFHANHGR
jgi:hypothetical protein